MAELIGAILGDGNIYDKRPTYIELCGNPNSDLDYFQSVLIPIVTKELGLRPKLFIRDGGLRFRINNKSFVEWLKDKGIPAGEAKSRAIIPDFILDNPKLLPSCVRGLYDTDGSIYYDMRPVYLRPYPRVDLHMTNHALLTQMTELLHKLGIVHSFARRKGSVITSGEEVLKCFLHEIGFSNSHHIERIGRHYPDLTKENRGRKTSKKQLRVKEPAASVDLATPRLRGV